MYTLDDTRAHTAASNCNSTLNTALVIFTLNDGDGIVAFSRCPQCHIVAYGSASAGRAAGRPRDRGPAQPRPEQRTSRVKFANHLG